MHTRNSPPSLPVSTSGQQSARARSAFDAGQTTHLHGSARMATENGVVIPPSSLFRSAGLSMLLSPSSAVAARDCRHRLAAATATMTVVDGWWCCWWRPSTPCESDGALLTTTTTAAMRLRCASWHTPREFGRTTLGTTRRRPRGTARPVHECAPQTRTTAFSTATWGTLTL